MARVSVCSATGGDWTRRELLAGLTAVPLAACVPGDNAVPLPMPQTGASLIDAHCHLFNISDLPTASFTQIVLLKKYEHAGAPTAPGRALRAALDGIESILSAGVISAADEAQSGAGLSEPESAAFNPADEPALEQRQREAEAALNALGGEVSLVSCDNGPGPSPNIRSIVTWLRDLRASRTRLTKRLTEAHAQSGFSSRLLCPALVDYANWLLQPLHSPLPHQVRVAGTISSNPQLVPVHGYAPFDPLRLALVREKLPVIDGGWDPIDLLRDALTSNGFAGVKLYPPMGFRATGNATSRDTYPPHVEALFSSIPAPPGQSAVGAALDRSLDELWQVCKELDAPVMAHAANSNAAGEGYGRRADPSFWLKVASDHPELRIMLAHFGRFRTPAAGFPVPQCSDDLPFDHTWEAAFGRFIKANPASGLYADVSYMSELFHPNERKRALGRMRQYLEFDPDLDHLIFGSDWVMLGIEKQYPQDGGYPHHVQAFFEELKVGPRAVANVMYGNAIKFLGLRAGSGTRARLARFLASHSLPENRLPS